MGKNSSPYGEKFNQALTEFNEKSEKLIQEFSVKFSNLSTKYTNDLKELNNKLTSISDIQTKAIETQNAINAIKTTIVSLQEEIEEISAAVMEDEENNLSIYTKIKNTHQSIQTIYSKVCEYKNYLFGYIANEAKEVNAVEYNALPNNSKKMENNKYYHIIKRTTPGIKDEIEEFLKKYEKFLEDDKENIRKRETATREKTEELYKRIDDLLPGATAAGLAEAYDKAKQEAQNKIRFWNIVFFVALLALGLEGIVLILCGAITFEKEISWDLAVLQLLRVFCFELPFIWVAWAANVKVSQYTRLYEEYGHKWTMMRVFDGMRSALENGSDANEENNVGYFYRSLLSAFAFNPSKIFDKKYIPDGPFSMFESIKDFFNNKKQEVSPKTENKE